jgi:orotidine-5'-phosphate decarboxylase
MYAKTFLEDMNFDSVTVAPYMGKDLSNCSLRRKQTYYFACANFQRRSFRFPDQIGRQTALYQQVIETSQTWKNAQNLMYVVGATKAEYFTEIRKLVPNNFLLVPGVGAQGGSLSEVCKYGMNKQVVCL